MAIFGRTPDPNYPGEYLANYTTVARTALVPASAGLEVFDTDLGAAFYWDGAAWIEYPGTAVAPVNETFALIDGGGAASDILRFVGQSAANQDITLASLLSTDAGNGMVLGTDGLLAGSLNLFEADDTLLANRNHTLNAGTQFNMSSATFPGNGAAYSFRDNFLWLRSQNATTSTGIQQAAAYISLDFGATSDLQLNGFPGNGPLDTLVIDSTLGTGFTGVVSTEFIQTQGGSLPPIWSEIRTTLNPNSVFNASTVGHSGWVNNEVLGFFVNAGGNGTRLGWGAGDNANPLQGRRTNAVIIDPVTLSMPAAMSNNVVLGTGTTNDSTSTVAIGRSVINTTQASITIGVSASATLGTHQTVVGPTTIGTAANTVVIGHQAQATDAQATAIGYLATASGINSDAIGWQADSTGNGSVSIGRQAFSANTGSVALGMASAANNISSLALGRGATASGDNSVSIGLNSATVSVNQVAIGGGIAAAAADRFKIRALQEFADDAAAGVAGLTPGSLWRTAAANTLGLPRGVVMQKI